MKPAHRRKEGGQVLILVAVGLLALIGSTVLVLLAGSVEWQKDQLQQLADETAIDSALKIGIGCDSAKAGTVITEADNFLAGQRTRTGTLSIASGTCATPYSGTDTFAGGLSSTVNYPYRALQQEVEVVLTLTLPISFGAELGSTSTTVVRRAVAQQLAGSVPAVTATSLTCAGGQVNVAGGIVTQNAIVRTGTCALYAHARYDATSGTYSDTGDIDVYADGQTWTSAGTCSAGGNSGSSNAICADGYELTGHVAASCATASTSFLSSGVALIDPNPCAAGTAPTPEAPSAISLPPEPNLDSNAVATLQGTGGAACTSSGVYSNIAAAGVTVGTGLGPAPLKDASGYYHFKPSCYGYLNLAGMTGIGISRTQAGPEVTEASSKVTPTLAAASQAGTLLVAVIRTSSTATAFTAPAGWVRAAAITQASAARIEIWYYANNPGAITSAAFSVGGASAGRGEMTEWSGVATASPLDQTGTVAVSTSAKTATISTGGATSVANELVITGDGYSTSAGTFTPGASWNSLVNQPTHGFSSEYRLDLPAAVASETETTTNSTTWGLAIASFKPAATAGGAVLDPGFYYFNGSGFAGGGGICLNGGTLLARDVTLEFVNQAGFSSGTCTAGGGANCSAPCQFGSPPCSIQTCPPNVGADSPNNLTWFAAPCSTAPSSLDSASCPGSAWCPAGDRSCSNMLIWTAASTTGQMAINGVSAQAWLLGSIVWPGTCSYQANGTSRIAGSIACTTLSIQAGAGAGTAVGSDAGVNTAVSEAVLIE